MCYNEQVNFEEQTSLKDATKYHSHNGRSKTYKLMLVQILKAVEKPGNLYSFVASVFVLSSETIKT